jgi:integrase
MAGSMRLRRPGVWQLRIYLGRDESGRVRHRNVTVEGTKRAAERELARLVADQERTPERSPRDDEQLWGPSTTINDAVDGWRLNGWQDLSPNTVRGYEGVWRRHVRDSIGRRRIATLSPYDVELYFRKLKAAGTGGTTIRLVRALLHRSCRLARKWSGNRLPNPISDTELPSYTPAERPVAVRSPERDEVLDILREATASADIRVAIIVRLAAATGMRRGEACALRWHDVDQVSATVSIDEGAVSDGGTTIARVPKTRASVRRVAVDLTTMASLAELRRVQAELALSCGRSLADDAFVFSFDAGGSTPPNPDNVTHAFARIRNRAGVARDVHLHSLRHFHATQIDSIVSEAQKQTRLGWSTVQMARHYTDGVAEEDRRAAEHVGRILGALDGVSGAEVSSA